MGTTATTTTTTSTTTGRLEVLGQVNEHHHESARCALNWVMANKDHLVTKLGGADKSLKVGTSIS